MIPLGVRRAGTERDEAGAADGMRGLINRIQELTGLYGLGINRDSAMGVLLPILFVVVVGGLGWLIVRNFL